MKLVYALLLSSTVISFSDAHADSREFFNPDWSFNESYSGDCEAVQRAATFAGLRWASSYTLEEAMALLEKQSKWTEARKVLTRQIVELMYTGEHNERGPLLFSNFIRNLCKANVK